MSHAQVTIVAPLDLSNLVEAQEAIAKLGNPAVARVRAALDRLEGDDGTHFASLHAFKSVDGARAYLLFEFSADGTEAAALARIVSAISPDLHGIFVLAADWKDGTDFTRYLTSHKVTVGGGWGDNPGLAFAGTPGMSVGRIRLEDRLARAVAPLAGSLPRGASQLPNDGLPRLIEVRKQIAADPTLARALEPVPVAPPFNVMPTPTLIGEVAWSFITTYFAWALYAIPVIAVAIGMYDAWDADGFWRTAADFIGGTVKVLWNAFWIALFLLIGAALLLYTQLRKAEAADFIDAHVAGPKTNTMMFGHENVGAQNHMISITQRKPGLVRRCTVRLIFWIIGALAPRLYRPGYLSDIGTIHFARWVTPRGSPDLVFLSNYGGSWESYLEDFITRAHAGLTGIWSNTIGFPRAENLIQLGATDGDRFKRFARHSMIPTRFWYSAYPALTTDTIRANTQIRAGLAGAMTEDEARRWLALFGSAARPQSKLVNTDIQSIIFGGFGFMPFSTCLILDLPDDARARAWLKAIHHRIAFNDGRRVGANAVVNLALGPRGLKRLGLPAEGLATFPFAFISGMVTDYRAKILGDTGVNDPSAWRWGREQADIALLIYGRSAEDVAELEADMRRAAEDHGLTQLYRRALKPVTKNKAEPFGFVDGTSQPVIRGTYKALRSADPIHIVEAGEFILGYPDNRGYMPLSPTLPALADPDNRLPLQASVDAAFDTTVVEEMRDIGFNGSFLVIRELEQDVAAFKAYCETEADKVKHRLPPPYRIDADFIGAKLLGRWPDGSSLVRHPYESETERRRKIDEHADQRFGGKLLMAQSATPMTRPTSKPEDATPVEAPPPKSAGATATKDNAPKDSDAEDDPEKIPPSPNYADNDFLFGAEDPEALYCPYGAHIRRANPRDSLAPGSSDQIAISNRHRIMRIGRQYEPDAGENPGLFFMCLNGDIERQFEFLQQSWLRSPSFHGMSCERDPILGDAEEGNCGFTIPSRYGPTQLSPLPRFVTTKGGGYFFLPGRRLLDYLGALP